MEVSARIARLPLAETFRISRETTDEAAVVQVEIRHGDAVGHGEAAPLERYDQSAESAVAYVEANADALGGDPWALDAIHGRLPQGEPAARSALDAALHDLCGKLAGVPLWKLLGLERSGPPTSWTIGLGDPDEMAHKAERDAPRFRRLKLKLGAGDGLDVDRVRAVRGVTSLPLQVDVNEGWTLDEALEALPQLAALDVQYCEQPLPAGDPGGPELRRASPLPIYVDEDCHTLADVQDCAQIAHGLTIKLAKSGGVREAVRMTNAGRALGLELMLGCMVETGLGIAPGAHIASLFDHVDLDGNLLIREDPWPGLELVDGVQTPSVDRPGLGVSPRG
jgi:L-alanine-DL-glutamate epimerase-like enolase superfamily enzyme